jgi:hypothetical protein
LVFVVVAAAGQHLSTQKYKGILSSYALTQLSPEHRCLHSRWSSNTLDIKQIVTHPFGYHMMYICDEPTVIRLHLRKAPALKHVIGGRGGCRGQGQGRLQGKGKGQAFCLRHGLDDPFCRKGVMPKAAGRRAVRLVGHSLLLGQASRQAGRFFGCQPVLQTQ